MTSPCQLIERFTAGLRGQIAADGPLPFGNEWVGRVCDCPQESVSHIERKASVKARDRMRRLISLALASPLGMRQVSLPFRSGRSAGRIGLIVFAALMLVGGFGHCADVVIDPAQHF